MIHIYGPRWSRGITFLILLLLAGNPVLAGTDSPESETSIPLKDLTVTGTRLPLGLKTLGRSVETLSTEEMRSRSIQTLPDALHRIPGVDLRERAPHGVQSEVSIRGADYQQISILVDGLPVNDPQTAHHSMNLSLPLAAVARVEVLKGPGALAHGSNALGGVVQMISLLPDQNGAALTLQGGEHGLLLAGLTLSQVGSHGRHRLNLQQNQSHGWTSDTDFRNRSAHLRSQLSIAKQSLDLNAGWAERKFGASTFYATSFPHQWEHTKTKNLQLALPTRLAGFDLRLQAAYRQHDDRFLLNRQDPSFYENIHRNRSTTLAFDAGRPWGNGHLLFSSLLQRHRLESSSMGNRERMSGSLHLAHRMTIGPAHLGLGGVLSLPEGSAPVLMPSMDLALTLGSHTTMIASFGGSWREPSFTDLYYTSPSNQGDPTLVSEDALGGELGLRHDKGSLQTALTLFERHSWNRLDWVRMDENQPWQARNIGNTTTTGLETSLALRPETAWLKEAHLSGTWLKAEHSLEGLQSKYALNFLTHQIKAGVQVPFLFGTILALDSRHERRRGKKDANWLADVRLSHHPRGGVDLFLDVRNLGNVEYHDQIGVPMPGRWFSAGCRLSLGGEAQQ